MIFVPFIDRENHSLSVLRMTFGLILILLVGQTAFAERRTTIQQWAKKFGPPTMARGCSWSDIPVTFGTGPTAFTTHIVCVNPGPGKCWEFGHDPRRSESPASIDIGNDPNSPNFNHPERCSGAFLTDNKRSPVPAEKWSYWTCDSRTASTIAASIGVQVSAKPEPPTVIGPSVGEIVPVVPHMMAADLCKLAACRLYPSAFKEDCGCLMPSADGHIHSPNIDGCPAAVGRGW